MAAPADPYDVVLLDLDGTVWLGDQAVPGAPAAVAALRAGGRRVGFLTNDPRSSRAEYAARLTRVGVPAAPEEVVTTGVALAELLRAEGLAGARALVLGTASFRLEVLACGVRPADGRDPAAVDLVVVGGSADLGYAELTWATRALRLGARLFGSGRDPTFPTPDGPVPASGAFLASVEVAGGATAVTAGKPERPIFDAARALLGGGPAAMVGDRLETDVAGAQRAGLAGVLVLTGSTGPADLAASTVVPDLVVPDLAAFAGVAGRPVPRPPQRPLPAVAPPARAGDGDELVVLLDPAGRPIGSLPKAVVHHRDTPLHLAFSMYVFDQQGRFLATRRALAKRTWPGVWTNSCCGHPRPGEVPAAAARRRLREELGLEAARLDLVLPDFGYRAVAADGVVENELCPVFFAHLEGDGEPLVAADPAEVAEWRWVSWSAFRGVATTAPWALSPWAAAQVPQLPSQAAI